MTHLIPGELIPIRLSLAPDGSQLAVQVIDQGKWRIQFFDLTQILELDQPSGKIRSTGRLDSLL